MKVKPDPHISPRKSPYGCRRSFRGDQAAMLKNIADQTHPKLKYIDNIHKGQTAWIFGSGASLDEVWDWNIPDNVVTFALNAGMVYFWDQKEKIKYTDVSPATLYRRRMDYWFAFDLRVTSHRLQPEWEYYNLAMRHPTSKKLIPEFFPSILGLPNVHRFKLQDKKTTFYKPYQNLLITGDSILTPALHYCYITGFKRIFLSGIDMCHLKIRGKYERYHTAMNQMEWRGNHLNVHGKSTIAPNSEQVMVSPMYNKHYLQIMAQIRFLQNHGVEVYKTSPRGMLSVNAINDERTMRAIINDSKEIRYAK